MSHFGQIHVQPNFNTFSYSTFVMNEHWLGIHISQPSHWTVLWTLRTALFAVSRFDHLARYLAVCFAKTTLGPGFVSMSPTRIIRIARLVPFDELKQRYLSELLRLPSFLMLVKQYEDPSANTLLPVLQPKFESAESEPFVHFQRIKPRTTTTGYMNRCLLTWNLPFSFVQFLQNQQQSWLRTRETSEQRWWGRDPTYQCLKSQGSDSVFATEHWQLQGASQYSALSFVLQDLCTLRYLALKESPYHWMC